MGWLEQACPGQAAACTLQRRPATEPLLNPPPPPTRYGFFGGSPLLGGTTLETEFDFGGTRVVVTTCIVEG